MRIGLLLLLAMTLSGCFDAMIQKDAAQKEEKRNAAFAAKIDQYMAQHKNRQKFKSAMLQRGLLVGMNCDEAGIVVRELVEPQIHTDTAFPNQQTWWTEPWGWIYFDHCSITRMVK